MRSVQTREAHMADCNHIRIATAKFIKVKKGRRNVFAYCLNWENNPRMHNSSGRCLSGFRSRQLWSRPIFLPENSLCQDPIRHSLSQTSRHGHFSPEFPQRLIKWNFLTVHCLSEGIESLYAIQAVQ
jgi:hypothetical protein